METKERDPYLDEDHLYNKYELLKMANERNMKEKLELQKRVEELESALQGARAHAEVMEHKATRVNAMLRDREGENDRLREAIDGADSILIASIFAPSSQYKDIIESARQRLANALEEVENGEK